MSTYVKINGVTIPSADNDGFTAVHEPVWGPKAGRSGNAKYHGKIVAHKWNLSYKRTKMTASEYKALIEACEKKDFPTVEFISPKTNSLITITCYVGSGSPSAAQRVVNGQVEYSGVSLSLIEQ